MWRATFKAQRGTLLIENVLHYSDSEPALNPASATDVADALNTKFTSAYRQLLTLDATFVAIDVREELAPGDTSIPASGSHANGAAGTRDASAYECSPALCGMIAKHTNAAVRGGAGRFFAPPVFRKSELLAGGFDNSASYRPAMTTMSGLMDDTLTGVGSVLGVGGSDLTPVVYSRTRRGRGDTNWFFSISSCPVSTIQHWLESRQH